MRVVSSGQMRSIDANAINNYGIPGIVLMENAALAVVKETENILSTKGKKDLRVKKQLFWLGKAITAETGWPLPGI